MSGDLRLEDALALSRQAADLAGWAVELARPERGEHELDIAEAVLAVAVQIQRTVSHVIDRNHPDQEEDH